MCDDLSYLNLERTTLTDTGLASIARMKKLRLLNLNRTPVSREAVMALSKELPHCQIFWQPLAFLPGGRVDVQTARQNQLVLGQPLPGDPRESVGLGLYPTAPQSNWYPIQVTAPTRATARSYISTWNGINFSSGR